MLTKQILRQLSDQGIKDYIAEYLDCLELTERRLVALRRRQKREPTWKHFDPMIQEMVGIGIRIEEQLAVKDELSDLLSLLAADLNRRHGLNQTIKML